MTFPRKQSNKDNCNSLLNDQLVTESGKIRLIPYDKDRGLFQCATNSYIFRFQKSDQDDIMDMLIVGKIDEYNNLVKLSSSEIQEATDEGFFIDYDYKI